MNKMLTICSTKCSIITAARGIHQRVWHCLALCARKCAYFQEAQSNQLVNPSLSNDARPPRLCISNQQTIAHKRASPCSVYPHPLGHCLVLQYFYSMHSPHLHTGPHASCHYQIVMSLCSYLRMCISKHRDGDNQCVLKAKGCSSAEESSLSTLLLLRTFSFFFQ